MMQKQIIFNFEVFETFKSLSSEDGALFNKAFLAGKDAYAPYSEFKVGAAIQLEENIIVTANNQENAAYPSGLCAERIAVFYAMAKYPHKRIQKIAIVAQSERTKLMTAVPPCGACRQSLIEYEERQKTPITIIFGTQYSEIYKVKSISDLLPLTFSSQVM